MTVAQIKQSVRERDGHKCTRCGMTTEEYAKATGTQLDVHRTTPGSEYSEDGCTTLCRKCHREVHAAIREEEPVVEMGRIELKTIGNQMSLYRDEATRRGLSLSAWVRLVLNDELERQKAK